jgi:UDP-N-acetylmuramoylalanine--D-glutamate ligase
MGSFLMNFVEELAGKNCLVIGAGVTGMAVQRALVKFGAKSKMFDENREIEQDVVNKISEGIELAIVSPGWQPDHKVIEKIRSSGTKVISEIDFAWNVKQVIAPQQKWIALSGTNGKTTTIKMVESIFTAAKINGKACGNVGETVIDSVCSSQPFDYLALELSSFQIEWSNLAKFKAIALLNISEDHIDWHGNYEKYINAKLKLIKHGEIVIANKSDPELFNRLSGTSTIWYSLNTPAPGELGIVENLLIDRAFSGSPTSAHEIAELTDVSPPVPHNVSNALAASALALSVGINYEFIKIGLKKFKPDHHRMELILDKDQVKWIDDSKATNPHAAIASILSNFNVIWIAGGLAKGASMDLLAKKCVNRLKAVILIGEDRELIAKSILALNDNIEIRRIDKIQDAGQLMQDVIKQAKSLVKPGDTVLLAPACASMDQFTSYVERGQLFQKAVRELV